MIVLGPYWRDGSCRRERPPWTPGPTRWAGSARCSWQGGSEGVCLLGRGQVFLKMDCWPFLPQGGRGSTQKWAARGRQNDDRTPTRAVAVCQACCENSGCEIRLSFPAWLFSQDHVMKCPLGADTSNFAEIWSCVRLPALALHLSPPPLPPPSHPELFSLPQTNPTPYICGVRTSHVFHFLSVSPGWTI